MDLCIYIIYTAQNYIFGFECHCTCVYYYNIIMINFTYNNALSIGVYKYPIYLQGVGTTIDAVHMIYALLVYYPIYLQGVGTAVHVVAAATRKPKHSRPQSLRNSCCAYDKTLAQSCKCNASCTCSQNCLGKVRKGCVRTVYVPSLPRHV